jgi:DNA-binding IscR family transcriptional regulator
MAKVGGIREVVSTFRRMNRNNNRRWLTASAISEETGINEARVRRILNRNTRLIRRSRGERETYILLENDTRS